jgi:chemotaxis receptor (MCP) glutamine deamidase CheD
MMGKITPARAVGAANIKAAELSFKDLTLAQVHWDVGGEQATEIVINCSTGEVRIRRVAKYGDEKEYAAS